MPKQAYNYNFKMFMEGIEVPFESIQVMCTPNGVEASINLLSNRQVFDIKPKTAVQVFYRDWVPVDGKYSWRLMFDGFLSSYMKNDQATQGRGLAIVCRDFRMDIRKAPAALVYQGVEDIHTRTLYHTAGINQKWVVRGFTPKSNTKKSVEKGSGIRVYESSGLQDLGFVISIIAGTAYGLGSDQKNGEFIYSEKFGKALTETLGKANCGMFLDAVVRGIWTEAVGGTAVSTFINRRIRVDKRFLIPKNNTGYNFWSGQTAGLEAGSVLMGNSRFSSIEAAIMRLAGLFSVRVYSCSTPSLISLESESLDWVMDPKVKKFLVDDHKKEFGGKYILNETMLLPPLEFTSPPNCNLFLPPMYDRVSWQYDIDGDVTRGYFKQIDMISTKGSGDLKGKGSQVPNALFETYTPNYLNKSKDEKINAKKDEYGRTKSPITLEERYKGVSVTYGSVEVMLAKNDATRSFPESTYKAEVAEKIRRDISKLKTKIEETINPIQKELLRDNLSKVEAKSAQAEQEAKKESNKKGVTSKGGESDTNTQSALDRHAILKFLNQRYAGRVAVVDMAFNPYPMSGFPGAIIVDDEAYGGESAKTIIGMVQQVKHMIAITPSGGDATTSIILNNARFEDEPTDVDRYGNPLYMKPTNPDDAEVDLDVSLYKGSNNDGIYYPPDPEPLMVRDLDDKYYDLDENKSAQDHIYAKDVISLSKRDIDNAKNNGSYLDNDYQPSRIHKFYKEVFSHKSEHFMIGEKTSLLDSTQRKSFAYDTMHEAFTELRRNKKYLLSNYEECIKFVHRDICSADAFFQGILGCSVVEKVYDDTGKFIGTKLVVNEKNYKPDVIHKRYFGITTDDWDKDQRVKGLKAKDPEKSPTSNGLMTAAGQFSSIKEHLPLTAFIQERRNAVEAYLTKIEQRVEGVQFANVQRYPESE